MRFLTVLAIMTVTACGRANPSADSGASPLVAPQGTQTAKYYVQESDLPACDAATDHWLVYVASTKTFKACNAGSWIIVDVTGPTGATGTQGAAGPPGANGSDSMASVWSAIEENAGAFLDIECAGGRGSGVKISDSAIVTAFHVIDGEFNCAYRSNGVQVATGGTFVQTDSGRDVAYIQGLTFNDASLPSIPMVRGVTLKLSAPIILVSYPEDLVNDFQATPGVVTDTDVTNSLEGILATEWAGAVMSDAAAGPGSSGGAIFDSSGRFIGIHVGGFGGASSPQDISGLELSYHLIFTNAD